QRSKCGQEFVLISCKVSPVNRQIFELYFHRVVICLCSHGSALVGIPSEFSDTIHKSPISGNGGPLRLPRSFATNARQLFWFLGPEMAETPAQNYISICSGAKLFPWFNPQPVKLVNCHLQRTRSA